jgi:hypothetical protein
MSAVLAEQPADLSAQLAAIRTEVAAREAERARALGRKAEAESDVKQNRATRERIPEFEAKVTALHEARSSGADDIKVLQKIEAAEKDLQEMREIAGRAELAERGALAAAKKFEAAAESAQARIDELRARRRQVSVQILREAFQASRSEYRAACTAFASGPMAQHFAMAAATVALAREMGLAGSELTAADLRDPEPGYAFQTSLSNTETVRGMFVDAWAFGRQAQEPFARRVAEIMAELRRVLALPE